MSERLAGADKLWHFQQAELMQDLPLKDLHMLVETTSDRVYQREEVVFEQGDALDGLFILNRGCVRLSVRHPGGRERIVGFVKAREIFGEQFLDPQNDYHHEAVAHEESWVSGLSREQFFHIVTERPVVALNYLRILNRRLTQAREEIDLQTFLDTEGKLARTLLRLAARHGREIAGRGHMTKVTITVSHRRLAHLIGANRSNVSSIMSRFRKVGLIDYQGRRILVHAAALEEFAGSGPARPRRRPGSRLRPDVLARRGRGAIQSRTARCRSSLRGW